MAPITTIAFMRPVPRQNTASHLSAPPGTSTTRATGATALAMSTPTPLEWRLPYEMVIVGIYDY